MPSGANNSAFVAGPLYPIPPVPPPAKVEIMPVVTSTFLKVFDIPSNDYHNELYGYLADVKKTKLDGLPEMKDWINGWSIHHAGAATTPSPGTKVLLTVT